MANYLNCFMNNVNNILSIFNIVSYFVNFVSQFDNRPRIFEQVLLLQADNLQYFLIGYEFYIQ